MKEKILKLIELSMRIKHLEDNDAEKWDVLKGNLYAISEGYKSRNMEVIEELQAEIDAIQL